MMWKTIFIPNSKTLIIWANALFLLLLLAFPLADPLTVVFAYFLETLIIGVLHVAKLWLVSRYGKGTADGSSLGSGIPLMLFFIFHYGMFVAVQSMFVFVLFGSAIPGFKSGFQLVYNFKYILQYPGMFVVLASLVANNLGQFYFNFLRTEKYRESAPDDIFMKPYLRIFIQQFVVILAFFFFIIFQSSVMAAVLLIVIRLMVDLLLYSLKNSNGTAEFLARKLAENPENYFKIKKQLQNFSE